MVLTIRSPLANPSFSVYVGDVRQSTTKQGDKIGEVSTRHHSLGYQLHGMHTDMWYVALKMYPFYSYVEFLSIYCDSAVINLPLLIAD